MLEIDLRRRRLGEIWGEGADLHRQTLNREKQIQHRPNHHEEPHRVVILLHVPLEHGLDPERRRHDRPVPAVEQAERAQGDVPERVAPHELPLRRDHHAHRRQEEEVGDEDVLDVHAAPFH